MLVASGKGCEIEGCGKRTSSGFGAYTAEGMMGNIFPSPSPGEDSPGLTGWVLGSGGILGVGVAEAKSLGQKGS